MKELKGQRSRLSPEKIGSCTGADVAREWPGADGGVPGPRVAVINPVKPLIIDIDMPL